MGEAKRRKKLLGSEYGKPWSRETQVAIFSRVETDGEIKKTELSRPPIPDVEYLKLKLNSVELREWLIAQWDSMVIFATPEDGDEIASDLLGRLSRKFSKDLNSDSTISYKVSPLIELSVGINVYYWTVWSAVIDRSKGFCFVTSDGDEFQLSSRILEEKGVV